MNILLDKYYMFFYYFQYYFTDLLSSSSNFNIFIMVFIFFILGTITIFTPCFIALLPIGISYIAVKNNSLSNIFIFVCGLLTSFLSFICFTSLISAYTIANKIPLISNFFLFLMSLDLMNIINFSEISSLFNIQMNTSVNQSDFVQNYLSGLLIGLSSLPCSTSVIAIFSFLTRNIDKPFLLSLYTLAYLCGLVFILLLLFSFNLYASRINLLSYFWKSFAYSGGSIIFIISLFSLMKGIFS